MRMVGVRDLAIGLGAVAGVREGIQAPEWLGWGAVADGVDALGVAPDARPTEAGSARRSLRRRRCRRRDEARVGSRRPARASRPSLNPAEARGTARDHRRPRRPRRHGPRGGRHAPRRGSRLARRRPRRSLSRGVGTGDGRVTSTTVPTKYWHALDDGRVQCDVCPRACKLREGQRGVCFVRAREGDADRAHHLRPVERLLRRPHREEAAEPLPARLVGAVVRHRGLQPRLPVLPELGHLEVEGDRHARRRRVARDDRRRRGASSAAAASRSPTTTR